MNLKIIVVILVFLIVADGAILFIMGDEESTTSSKVKPFTRDNIEGIRKGDIYEYRDGVKTRLEGSCKVIVEKHKAENSRAYKYTTKFYNRWGLPKGECWKLDGPGVSHFMQHKCSTDDLLAEPRESGSLKGNRYMKYVCQ